MNQTVDQIQITQKVFLHQKTYLLRVHLPEEVDFFGYIGATAEENIELVISMLFKASVLAKTQKGLNRAENIGYEIRTKEHIILEKERIFLYKLLKKMIKI